MQERVIPIIVLRNLGTFLYGLFINDVAQNGGIYLGFMSEN